MTNPGGALHQTLTCAAVTAALAMVQWHNTLSFAEASVPSASAPAASALSVVSAPVGSGTPPYWTTRKSSCASPPATRSSPAEFSRVVVIGAGMSGASAAMHLAQQGVSVTLMDARGVSGGATGRNGGFLCPPALATLALAATSGRGFNHVRDAAELLLFERDNRAAIRAFVHARGVACELDQDADVFQVFDSTEELRAKVGVLWPVRSLACLAGVEVLSTRSELREALSIPLEGPWRSGLRIRGGTDTFCAADVAKQCVVDAVSAGADWLPETCAISLEEAPDGGGVTVVTESGCIRCDKVIVATNAYIPSLVPSLSKFITPIRNHVGVTTPASPLNKAQSGARCGISGEDGFVYLHQRPDGRVVVGGFRHLEDGKGVGKGDDSMVVDHVADSVRQFVPSRFCVGEDVVVDQVWTGVIGWSCDDLPWVGPVPRHPSVLVCGGFSGHGLTQTFLCGKAVASMALGQKPSHFVDRFLPSLDRQNTANLVAGHTSHHL
jgi:glycine/D-amino acid oxidase-like deaminating enzyme